MGSIYYVMVNAVSTDQEREDISCDQVMGINNSFAAAEDFTCGFYIARRDVNGDFCTLIFDRSF